MEFLKYRICKGQNPLFKDTGLIADVAFLTFSYFSKKTPTIPTFLLEKVKKRGGAKIALYKT